MQKSYVQLQPGRYESVAWMMQVHTCHAQQECLELLGILAQNS